MSALTVAGVPKEAIESAEQSLSPLEPNGDTDKARYAQGIRFEFSQSWHVTVPAEGVANVLHVAITAGANDSGGIDWELKKDDALEAEAAKKEIEAAKWAGRSGTSLHWPSLPSGLPSPRRSMLCLRLSD